MIAKSVRRSHVYAHVDAQGRVYLDKCATDTEHLVVPVEDSLPDHEGRRRCRTYVSDLVPSEFIGKKGTWTISIEFEEDDHE